MPPLPLCRLQLALAATSLGAAAVVPDPDPFAGAAVVLGVNALCGAVRSTTRHRLTVLRSARLAGVHPQGVV